MSTVTKELAEEIIANNGYYENDPRIMQVVKYRNKWGGDCWAILYQEDVDFNRYEETEYVNNPTVIWEAK